MGMMDSNITLIPWHPYSIHIPRLKHDLRINLIGLYTTSMSMNKYYYITELIEITIQQYCSQMPTHFPIQSHPGSWYCSRIKKINLIQLHTASKSLNKYFLLLSLDKLSHNNIVDKHSYPPSHLQSNTHPRPGFCSRIKKMNLI